MHALCLSAGGMFGAYQAGVWLELNRVWKPDLVVGASIGALNGYAIAGGLPAEQLVDRWLDLPALARHRIQVPLPPWKGAVDARPVETIARQLHAEVKPRIPLGVVATEWRNLRPRLFQGEAIGWEHLAASCAVPGILPQYKLEGRRFTDGGLLSALPLWAAVDMGATHVVAVNVLPRMPWFVRWPLLTVKRLKFKGLSKRREVVVVSISPNPGLGGWKEASWWNRTRSQRYIELGQRDAREAWGRIS